MNCPNCGKPLQEGAKFCMGCGQRIPRCPTCGTVLLKRAKFCMVDGTRIPDEVNALIPEVLQTVTPAAAVTEVPAVEEPMADTPALEVPVEEAPVEKSFAEETPVREAAPAEEPPVQKEVPVVAEPVSVPVEKPVKAKPVQVKQPVRHVQPATPQTPEPPVQDPVPPKPERKKKSILPILAIVAVVILLVVGLLVGKALLDGNGAKLNQSEAMDGIEEVQEGDAAPENTAEAAPEDAAQAESEQLQEMEPTQEETQPTEPEPILMPNCIGWHYDEVVQTFEAIPCQLSFEYAYSDTVGENYILQQNFAEGSELTAETAVVFTVSKGPDVAPEGYNQKVTVTAAPDSSYGTLTLYDWENGQWVSKFSCDATLGSKGISPDYGEGRKRTPEGVFKLGVALTANSLSNSSWPVHLVTSDTCVVDDVNSPLYNTIQSIQGLSGSVSYDPIGRTITQGTSNICIYIEHNGNGYDSENVEVGKGSVITICGRNSGTSPTSGCVDISASNMNNLISMLSYEKNPHIEIYVQ